MRLYYFTTERYGLEALRDNRLKIARINELNDPFEFLGLRLDRADRKIMGNWKKQIAEHYGLLCMSRDWTHPLLWGHYASKHQGLCLGFEVPDHGAFKEVTYHAKRPTLQAIGCNHLHDLDEGDMNSLLFKKFDGWAYESEYRAFLRLDEKDPASDLYFAPFSDNLKLVQVIVGQHSSVTRERLAGVLGERSATVTAFKARAGFTRFEVVENQSQKAWPLR